MNNRQRISAGRLFRTILCVMLAVIFCGMSAPMTALAYDPKAPDCNITYDFGNGQTCQIGNDTALTMCVTNPDGSYLIDPATGKYVVDPWKVLNFLNSMKSMYSGKGRISKFRSTRGDLIDIAGGTEFAMDVATELPYLYSAIIEERTETRSVAYGVGSSYVEVDMSLQMLYVYSNGVKILETPVVTGNTSLGHGTPTGIYYINRKQRDTVLVGADYRSPVAYWVPFIRNSIGLHDATWRSAFGGSIYRTNGSHGCVNIPPAVMPAVYEVVSVGMPVVLFY